MRKGVKKFYIAAAVIFIATVSASIYLYGNSTGKIGQTRKTTTAGCGAASGCHGLNSTASLNVAINGPASLTPNQTATFEVQVTGSSGPGGGVDIAVSNGALNQPAANSNLRLENGELTHKSPQTMPITYTFTYTAPGSPGTVTMYANAKGSGFMIWNWANNKTITISNPPPPPPVAEFTGAPTSGVRPLTVQFTDASTGSITSRSWSFGDGGTSTLQSPSRTYTTAGVYTVILTVTGPGGSNARTRANYITVTEVPPVAEFTGTPTSGVRPLTVQFTDASTGTITSRSWNFGDGSTSTLQNPSRTYTTAGAYTVTLTVTGPGGSITRTRANYITVTDSGFLTAVDHTTGPLTFRLFNNGVYGYNDTSSSVGGFSFLGLPGRTLYAGGLVVGTSAARLALNAPSFIISGNPLINFATAGGFSGLSSNRNFNQIGECVYSERAPLYRGNPLGISVKQTSFSRASDAFAIIRLEISNPTAATIFNFYAGQFGDWDIGDFNANRGGYDAARALLYQFELGGGRDPNYYGIRALSSASGARLQTGDINPDSVFSFLSNFRGPGPQLVTRSADYRSFIGSGPFNLAPGAKVTVGFAWVAGTNLASLIANADLAKTLWETAVVRVEEKTNLAAPTRFTLEPNFPNPFRSAAASNAVTQISYALPENSGVILQVHNMLGHLVRTLVQTRQAAGHYTVAWDGRNEARNPVPSGVYFFVLEAEKMRLSRKMILIQ